MNGRTRTSIKTGIAAAIGVAAVLALAPSASAGHGSHGEGERKVRHGDHGPMGGGVLMAFRGINFHELDLSEAQREQIHAIHEERRAELEPVVERLRLAHEALRNAALAEPLDDVQLQANAEELALVQSELAVSHARTLAAAFQVLTPEQQEEAKAQIAERGERRIMRHRR